MNPYKATTAVWRIPPLCKSPAARGGKGGKGRGKAMLPPSINHFPHLMKPTEGHGKEATARRGMRMASGQVWIVAVWASCKPSPQRVQASSSSLGRTDEEREGRPSLSEGHTTLLFLLSSFHDRQGMDVEGRGRGKDCCSHPPRPPLARGQRIPPSTAPLFTPASVSLVAFLRSLPSVPRG